MGSSRNSKNAVPLKKGIDTMPIKYDKLFVLLKEKGWNPARIRKEGLIGQGTLTNIRNGKGGLDNKTIARICKVLKCQPGDIMEYDEE